MSRNLSELDTYIAQLQDLFTLAINEDEQISICLMLTNPHEHHQQKPVMVGGMMMMAPDNPAHQTYAIPVRESVAVYILKSMLEELQIERKQIIQKLHKEIVKEGKQKTKNTKG